MENPVCKLENTVRKNMWKNENELKISVLNLGCNACCNFTVTDAFAVES